MRRIFSQPRLNPLRRRVARALTRRLLGGAVAASSEPLPLAGIHRILVCHVSHTLGNALLLTPLLQELEAVYPGAEVDIVTRSQVGDAIYGGYVNVARVIRLPQWGFSHPLRYLRELRYLRRDRYDLVIDPDPQSQTNRLLALLASSRWTLGFDGPKKSGQVTHPVPLTGAPAAVGKRPVYLLRRALGRQPDAMPYPSPDIRLSRAEREQGRQVLDRLLAAHAVTPAHNGVIGIFANATGPKLLGRDWWDPFLHELESADSGHRIVEIVPAFGRSLLDSRYPAYFSNDLRKLASVLSALTVYISADCGVMHLADAAGAPTYGIFNRTNADEWGSYAAGNHVVRAHDLTPAEVAQEILSVALSRATTPAGAAARSHANLRPRPVPARSGA